MPTAHVIDYADRRKASRQAKLPIVWDQEAAEIVLAVVGVEVGPETVVKVRITDADGKGEKGYARRIGPDAFLVKVRVAKKPVYTDAHAYVVNNTLVHELRHVAQMQADPQQGAKYQQLNATVGYAANPYEADAFAYGRLADHTGTKDTMGAGKAMGRALWAIIPAGVVV